MKGRDKKPGAGNKAVMEKSDYSTGQQMSSLVHISTNNLLKVHLWAHLGDPNNIK